MTDIDSHILNALNPKYGLTPLEVMSRCPKGITYQAIRKRLRELADEEMVQCKIIRGPSHAVREYRAWR